MRLHNRLHNRQTQTSRSIRTGTRLIGTGEAVKNLRQEVRGNTRTVIGHGHHGFTACSIHGQARGHARTLIGVLASIREQVQDHALNLGAIGNNLNRLVGQVQVPFVGARCRLHVGGAFKHQLGQVNLLQLGFATLVQASKGQKVLDEA